MTEDEAKTKWCPMARVGSEQTGLGSINRDCRLGEKTLATNCIASACAAWRWATTPALAVTEDAETDHSDRHSLALTRPDGEGWEMVSTRTEPAEPGLAAWHYATWRREQTPATAGDGYCGLAGVPA